MKNQPLLTILTIYVTILGFVLSIYGIEQILLTLAAIGLCTLIIMVILMFLSVCMDIIYLIIESINRIKRSLK